MASHKTNITLPKEIKAIGQRASRQVFEDVNLSGYIQILIIQDCERRGIK